MVTETNSKYTVSGSSGNSKGKKSSNQKGALIKAKKSVEKYFAKVIIGRVFKDGSVKLKV